MALVKCKECGHEVSKKAKQCPNCGAPQGPKHYSLGKLVVVLLFGWFIYSLFTVDSHGPAAPPTSRNISPNSFSEPWPFSVSDGDVSCDAEGGVTFAAKGKSYGINGIAQTAGHPSPDEIWKQIPDYEEKVARYAEGLKISKEEARKKMGPIRVSIQPILDAGLALCR